MFAGNSRCNYFDRIDDSFSVRLIRTEGSEKRKRHVSLPVFDWRVRPRPVAKHRWRQLSECRISRDLTCMKMTSNHVLQRSV